LEKSPHSRSIINNIFISPTESRLRAGWRILLQTILLGVFFCIVAFPVGWFGPGKSQTWVLFFFSLAECFAITVSIIYARRFFDKRSFISLGLTLNKVLLADFLAGMVISFIMMGSIFLLALVFKWITLDGFAWTTDGVITATGQTFIWLLIFIFIGWQEELLSRGYHLQNISEGINLVWGVILSSLAFSIFHLLNPGASTNSVMGIFLAGLFLSLAYVMTRHLWLPISLHIGWNFFEGVVFGFPVSGLKPYPLMKLQVTGPSIWVGGDFGPEAGLILIPALLLGGLSVFFYSKVMRSKYA